MSTIIMTACWPLQGMNATQKAVLISLADNANDDGVCWPSIEYIAKRTCLSPRSVQSAIKWLQDASILKLTERAGRSNVYLITPAEFAPPQTPHPAKTANTPANNVKTPADAAGAPAIAAPRTINNRNRTVKEPPKQKLALPDWLPSDLWAMWDRFRKRKDSKAWTEDAKQLSLRTLARLRDGGNDPQGVIEQSIERGWTGLFELKNKTYAGAKQHGNFGKQDYHAGVGADGRF